MRNLSLPLRGGFVAVLLVALMLCAAPVAAQTAFPLPTGGTPATAVLITVAPLGTPTPAPGSYAALVVRFGEGSVLTRCVHFDEAEINGDELLVRSGLQLVMDPSGSVCAISGQGCPADDCFCACPFPNCEYWGYYHLADGQWLYSDYGASFSAVRDGDMEGWSWGQGNFNSQDTLPPLIPFEQICPAVDLTVTPTPTRYTPLPSYTRTPSPTPSPTPAPPPPAEIPEPATLLLLVPGLAALGAWARSLRRHMS